MRSSRKNSDVPSCPDDVRRKVLSVVNQVERETNLYLDRYMRNTSGDYANWLEYINDACNRLHKDPNKLEEYKDFELVLNMLKGDPDITQYTEYNTIRRVIERGKMFDYIAFSLKNELFNTFSNYLKKYCISFQAEAKGERLKSVEEYESKILEWTRIIEDRLSTVDTILDEHDSIKTPFSKYIEMYGKIITMMQEACRAMQACCKPMRKWIMCDSTYPGKLQEEINVFNKNKMGMRDIIKQLEIFRDGIAQQARKRAHILIKTERVVNELKMEKKQYKIREKTLQENVTKMEATRDTRKADLEEVKGRILNRKENSPTVFNYLTSMQENLRGEVRGIDVKIDTMAIHIASLRNDQHRVQAVIAKHQASMNGVQQEYGELAEQLRKAEDDVDTVKEEVRKLDNKISTLKRIREIKLHSDTIKKIYHYGYIPGDMQGMKDDLQEAFRLTAEDVGRDWISLYQQLPFAPPRDYQKRSHDIEVIDLSNRRSDRSYDALAIKSLEKWRRLSTNASVPNLLKTLRKLKKLNTVRKITKTLRSSREFTSLTN